MSARCPVCGSERFEPLLTAYDRTRPRREDYPYARCQGCSLVSLHPPPKDHEVAALYPADYAPHDPELRERPPGARERFAARNRFARDAAVRSGAWGHAVRMAARAVEPAGIDPRGGCRMLDVGCGSGALMARHAARGCRLTLRRIVLRFSPFLSINHS